MMLRVPLLRFETLGIIFLLGGCENTRFYNTRQWIDRPGPVEKQTVPSLFMRNNYYYPVRDFFDPHVFASLGNPDAPVAWDIDDNGEVADNSYYTNRPITKITPAQAAQGAATAHPPQPPWTILKKKNHDNIRQFTGKDALGRKFMVKFDDPKYPEAGSGAAIISARILWLLGYNIPPNYLVTIDGQRAEASLFIDSKLGPSDIDTVRYRREMRALRLASAWIDDLDRVSNNTLIVTKDGINHYYLIDFNSTLGLWQGQPKQPWQGHRHIWDPNWGLSNVLSFGALERAQIHHREPVSRSVGIFYDDDFDPMAWKTQQPNSPFRFMTREDARWMARKIAQISPEQIRSIVQAARYSDPEDEKHVRKTLLARQQKIVAILNKQP